MRLKFLCLNVWNGGKLFDALAAFLAAERADVLALQEVRNSTDSALPRDRRTAIVLQEQLGYPHAHFAPAFLDHRVSPAAVTGNLILSRFPILRSEATFGDIPYGAPFLHGDTGDYRRTPRNLQHCELEANATTVHIFNTQGVWGRDGNDNPRRLAMGEAIAQAVAPHPNVILAGDFNVQDGTQTLARIERHLRNLFTGERTTSFNMRRKTNPGYATAVVDMVFASPTFRVLEHRQPDVDVSDHLPLVCVLETR